MLSRIYIPDLLIYTSYIYVGGIFHFEHTMQIIWCSCILIRGYFYFLFIGLPHLDTGKKLIDMKNKNSASTDGGPRSWVCAR